MRDPPELLHVKLGFVDAAGAVGQGCAEGRVCGDAEMGQLLAYQAIQIGGLRGFAARGEPLHASQRKLVVRGSMLCVHT